MHYTETEIRLDIQLSNIPFQALELQISPETAVIRAKSLIGAVEGFFSADQLEGIIPFPMAVHPETVCAKLYHNVLTLTLPKSAQIDRQRLLIHFNQNYSAPEAPAGSRSLMSNRAQHS